MYFSHLSLDQPHRSAQQPHVACSYHTGQHSSRYFYCFHSGIFWGLYNNCYKGGMKNQKARKNFIPWLLTLKKAECRRIDAFELLCWRRLLRVSWTARRSNQSILKEISPGISLEGMMLKLKLQYFGSHSRLCYLPNYQLRCGVSIIFQGRRQGSERFFPPYIKHLNVPIPHLDLHQAKFYPFFGLFTNSNHL